ncbi:hypothetical protein F9L33_09630 [Amylibacter sp. SFDW26]|uniref:hypothetical protein n=1 Tax=Amylibacter sp. SFDW26 TaxID=2652722 RepID=UPI001261C629|nr:hypothetical protein [Amylibacter sp. SFDW26]KAB7613629.1 hypothetical protein F9L33_09630 [Amylibacter sp. SFDW26]
MAKIRLFSISSIELALLKSNPPQLSITVAGLATTSGWSNPELKPMEKVLSADGILDLDFVAEPPSGIALQALTPIVASVIWEDDVERLIGVKVYSRSGDQVQLLAEINTRPINQLAPTNIAATPSSGNQFTTLALGEEGGPTTLAIGEESGPTTFVFGEEGPDLKPFFGETDPRVDDPKPAFGEGGPALAGFRDPFGRR